MGRLNQRMTYYVRNIYKKIYEMSKNNIYYIGCMWLSNINYTKRTYIAFADPVIFQIFMIKITLAAC